MANDGLQNRTFPTTLTTYHHDARQLESITLVNTQQHTPDFDELPREMHKSVLSFIDVVLRSLRI